MPAQARTQQLDLPAPPAKPAHGTHDALLAKAAEVGLMPPAVVSALLAVFSPGRLSLDDRRFLDGPFIVHESPWNATRPAWMAEIAGGERVAIALGQAPLGMIIGPAELAMVMYGRTLDAPLGYRMTDLYVWASANAVAKWKQKTVEQVFSELDMKPVTDAQVLQPRGMLHNDYWSLAHDVRRKVIAAQTLNERAAHRRDKADAKLQKPARPVVASMFDLFGEPPC